MRIRNALGIFDRLGFRQLLFKEEQTDNHDSDADCHADICEIEHRKIAELKIKIIHNASAAENAVDQIAESARSDQRQRDLQPAARLAVAVQNIQAGRDHNDRKDDQKTAVSAEHTERCTVVFEIAQMHPVEAADLQKRSCRLSLQIGNRPELDKLVNSGQSCDNRTYNYNCHISDSAAPFRTG